MQNIAGKKRPDIQGLRALAVLLVVVYHLWPTRLSGGYVGVDVFFVISGFLITAHLVSEVDRTGTVGVTSFWARRIRRLLPAAFTVLLVSTIAAIAILPKAFWRQTFSEVGASALYVQNWVLAGSSVDYLDANNSPTLAQHYWSLSVEEQFYIIWPLIVLLAVFLAARIKLAGVDNGRSIATSLLVVFAASFVFSIYETAHSQPSAYFVTATRAWEFAAGGLLVFIPSRAFKTVSAPMRDVACVAAGWAGLFLILASAVFFDSRTQFPGFVAMLPVVGAMVMIQVGTHHSRWSVGYLANFGPAQFLGDISYSLYLWHWPLIVLYPFVVGTEIGVRGGLVVFALAVALAWATKVLIEDPFRTRTRFSGRKAAYRLAAGGMAFFFVVALTGTQYINTLSSEAKTFELAAFSASELTDEIEKTLDADEWAFPDQLPGRQAIAEEWGQDDCLNIDLNDIGRCTYGDSSAESTAVVLGDSAATSYLAAIRGALAGESWKIIPLTLEQCPASDILVTMAGVTPEYSLCTQHRLLVEKLVPKLKPDLVIFVSAGNSSYKRFLDRATGHQADLEWSAGIESFTKKFAAPDTELIVIGDAVRANCVTTYGATPSSCVDTGEPAEAGRVEAERAAALAAGARYIDTRSWMCGRDLSVCPEQIGSTLVRADGSHLTNTFSSRLRLVMQSALLDQNHS